MELTLRIPSAGINRIRFQGLTACADSQSRRIDETPPALMEK